MTEKAKPRLHLVRGGTDPELHNPDLEWFFCSYDSECGLKSIAVQDILNFVNRQKEKKPRRKKGQGWDYENTRFEDGSHQFIKAKTNASVPTSDPYGSAQVDFNDHCSFSRGRRIWNRLGCLTWSERELLREYYEPRQLWESDEKTWEKEGGLKARHIVWSKQPDDVIRAIHRAYYMRAA